MRRTSLFYDVTMADHTFTFKIDLEQGRANYGPPTLIETSMYLIYYDRDSRTCHIKKPKTIEAIIERTYTILSLN